MKATLPWLAAVLVAVLAVPAVRAQYFGSYACPCPPQAPDACGPGFYAPNMYGAYYGPNYYLRPYFPPFNGMAFAPSDGNGNGNGSPAFPTHPYARSPRDFFMVGTENTYSLTAAYGPPPSQLQYVAPPPPVSLPPVAPPPGPPVPR